MIEKSKCGSFIINFHLLQEEDYMQHERCFINTRLLFGSYSRRRRLYKW